MSTFSIIIPTYNRCELLGAALDSVAALRVPAGWRGETVVVDNNSCDATGLTVARFAGSSPIAMRRVVEMRQGLNHARNRGIEDSRGEYLIYLDDDMVVDPGWLEAFAGAVDKLDADAVTGPVEPMFEVCPPDWLAPRVLDAVTSPYSHKGPALKLLGFADGHELPGCNFAVKRSVARDMGGFHIGLDRCGEAMLGGGDSEFGERLALAGKRIAYAPGCKIHHHISSAKISRAGLRARFAGSGATQMALLGLRNEVPSVARRCWLFLRMLRFWSLSAVRAGAGDSANAFRWELEARRLYAFLFKAPKGFVGRDVPPPAPGQSI